MKINHYPILAVALAVALAMAAGCRKQQAENPHAEASKLYKDVCATTRAYVDSISRAPDSASVMGFVERFDEALVDVNYEAAPDTDYQLNEAENDTIEQLMVTLQNAVHNRLKHLAARKQAQPDSIKADSAK